MFKILLPLTSGVSQLHRKQKDVRPLIPNVNLNATKKRQVEKFIRKILRHHGLEEGKPKFPPNDKLWLRIFYFNHNIVKPTLDLLEGFVYPNDRNIIYLESVRLDMQSLQSDDPYFEIETDMSGGVDDILKIRTETCFLIEAGRIRPNLILPTQSTVVNVGAVMKEQFESYFAKALHDAKIEELLRGYRNKRFSAKKNVKADDMEFDVVVEKNGKAIAFEITAGPLDQRELSRIEKLHETAKSLYYEFRVVTIPTPKKATIEIKWLKDELLRYLRSEEQALDEPPSTHADYEEIRKLTVRSIRITDSEADVSVSGDVSVNLGHTSGPNAEKENDHEILPFNGELSLNLCENTIRHARLKIDISYWYE